MQTQEAFAVYQAFNGNQSPAREFRQCGGAGERVCGFLGFPTRLAFVKRGPETEVA